MAFKNLRHATSLNIVFEKGDNEIWGRIEHEDFLLTTVGNSHEEIVKKLQEQVYDFLRHEGSEKQNWRNINIDDISFEFQYDLTEFFEEFKMLKIGSIAKLAGINPSLMRQYTSGVTFPSEKQVIKIQNAITKLSQMLAAVQLNVTEN